MAITTAIIIAVFVSAIVNICEVRKIAKVAEQNAAIAKKSLEEYADTLLWLRSRAEEIEQITKDASALLHEDESFRASKKYNGIVGRLLRTNLYFSGAKEEIERLKDIGSRHIDE